MGLVFVSKGTTQLSRCDLRSFMCLLQVLWRFWIVYFHNVMNCERWVILAGELYFWYVVFDGH